MHVLPLAMYIRMQALLCGLFTLQNRKFHPVDIWPHKINSQILFTARLYFKSRVKIFDSLLYNINVPPEKIFQDIYVFYILYWVFSAILNCQFQTNRTLKEISLHFKATTTFLCGFPSPPPRSIYRSTVLCTYG